MTQINDKLLEKIARMANLELLPEEEERFCEDISKILSFVEKLQDVNTDGVSPLFSPLSFYLPLAQDDVYLATNREAILQNAPELEGNFFVVPKVIQ